MNKEVFVIYSNGEIVNQFDNNEFICRSLAIQLFKCKTYSYKYNASTGLYTLEFNINENMKYVFDNMSL